MFIAGTFPSKACHCLWGRSGNSSRRAQDRRLGSHKLLLLDCGDPSFVRRHYCGYLANPQPAQRIAMPSLGRLPLSDLRQHRRGTRRT